MPPLEIARSPLILLNSHVVLLMCALATHELSAAAAAPSSMQCFHQIMVGIYFLQFMVAALLGVKKFTYVLLIIPLPLITILFHQVMTSTFRRPWQLMSLKEAALLDARDGTVSSLLWLAL